MLCSCRSASPRCSHTTLLSYCGRVGGGLKIAALSPRVLVGNGKGRKIGGLSVENALLDCPEAACSEVLLELTFPQQMLCVLLFTGKSWMLQSFSILAACFTLCAGRSPIVPQIPIHSPTFSSLLSAPGAVSPQLSCPLSSSWAWPSAGGEKSQGVYPLLLPCWQWWGPGGPQVLLGARLDPNCSPHQKAAWEDLDPKLRVSTQARWNRQTDDRIRWPSLLLAAWKHYSAWEEERQVPEQRGFLSNLSHLHWLLGGDGRVLGSEFFFFATPCGMWDLSSPTRDPTLAPCIGSAEF